MRSGSSKEPSHSDGSFEYPQLMFWMRNKGNNFPIHTLIWRPGHCTDLGPNCLQRLLEGDKVAASKERVKG